MSLRMGNRHAEAGGAALPPINLNILGSLQPEIDAACDELIRSGVRVPTRETVEQMTKRIFDNVCAKFPHVADFARAYDRNFPAVRNESVRIFDVEIKQDGAFGGLLAFLLLSSFFFRRRVFRRFTRRFSRRFF